MNPDQAILSVVCDAALVRKADLGRQLLLDLAAGRSTERTARLLVHLCLGIEQAALSVDQTEQQEITAHLIENYGLLAITTDPFLRPLLPPISIAGTTVVRRVLGIGGRALSANGNLLAIGVTLIPN